MLESGETWFLLADGRKARVLVEQRRGANLQERSDLAIEISEDELYDIQDRPPRNSNRIGEGKHTVDRGRDLHEQEEVKFLQRVADRLAEAEKQRQFEHLVIAAPPRALGTLREKLPQAVQQRIRASTPKDILDEDTGRLRERLTEMLRQ